MQRLAEKGTVYKNAYCSSPLCLPSRSAFLTGRRVHQIHTYSNCNINLDKSLSTYGCELSKQGIHTAYIGKTHAFDKPANLGFNEMILPYDFDLPGDINHRRRPLWIRKGAAARACDFGPMENPYKNENECINKAMEWIVQRAPKLDKPWVFTVSLPNLPHFPHFVAEKHWEMYPGGGDLPKYGKEEESANHPYAVDLRNHFETERFSEEQIRGLRRGYLGRVTAVDEMIGQIVDALEKSGQLQNTNIIYTSDHGEMLGKFGMWWKCSLYEDSARIPMLAAGPDFKNGGQIETPVDLLDLNAYLFDSHALKRPDNWAGIPLNKIAENDKNRVIFSEYHGHGTRSGAYMIRKGEWKLIYYMEAFNQLFNLSKDPHELDNIIEKYPDKASELERELKEICSPEIENEYAHKFEDDQFKVIGVP